MPYHEKPPKHDLLTYFLPCMMSCSFGSTAQSRIPRSKQRQVAPSPFLFSLLLRRPNNF